MIKVDDWGGVGAGEVVVIAVVVAVVAVVRGGEDLFTGMPIIITSESKSSSRSLQYGVDLEEAVVAVAVVKIEVEVGVEAGRMDLLGLEREIEVAELTLEMAGVVEATVMGFGRSFGAMRTFLWADEYVGFSAILALAAAEAEADELAAVGVAAVVTLPA